MTKPQRELTPSQARAKAGLTQEEVARRAGVSLRTVTRMEAKNAWPAWSTTRARIKAALGVAERQS